MPSEEMLRKLLDEFVEKQVLIDEEMKAVADQVQQLERRLIGCRERLSTIGGDRQKVVTMQTRYLEGSLTSTGHQYYPPTPTPVVNTPAPPQAVTSTPEPPAQLAPKLSTPPPPAPVSAVPMAPAIEAPALQTAPPPPPVVEPEAPVAPVEPAAAVETKSPSLNDFLTDPVEDNQPSPFNYPTEAGVGDGKNLNNIFDDDAAEAPVDPQINKGPSSTFASILSSRNANNQTAQTQPAEPTATTEPAQEVEPASGFGVLDRFTEGNQTQDNGGTQAGAATPATAFDKDGNAIVDLGATEEADDDNDTVKSINDALRSLFR